MSTTSKNERPCDAIRIVSFNCKSLKNSVTAIPDLCTNNDIVLLQETWLTKQDLHLLKSLDPDFNGEGISSINL